MTREEMNFIGSMNMCDEISNEAYKKIMCHCEEQEPCEDAISLANVFGIMENLMSIPYDFHRSITEKDISESMDEIRELPRVTPQEPFINKLCVSEKVCEHDKHKVLDKIRAEIEQNAYPIVHGVNNQEKGMTLYGILHIVDKYKAESEE